MTDGDGAGPRRAFRAWVRAQHPDAGGDPDVFAAGLAQWRAQLAGAGREPAPVTVFRTRGGLWRVQRWRERRRRGPRVS